MEGKRKGSFNSTTRRNMKMGKSIALLSSLVFLLLFTSYAIAQECACNGCHGNPPSVNTVGGPNGLAGVGTSAGAHLLHTGLTPLNPSFGGGVNPICETCHTGGMPADWSTAFSKLKIGFKINGDYVPGTYDGATSYNGVYTLASGTNSTTVTQKGSMTCTVSCHSPGTGGTKNVAPSGPPPLYDPRPASLGSTPPWNTTSTITCNACHGSGTTDGRPSYVQDQPKSNSHLYTWHANQTCDVCHYATTHDGVSIFDPTKHGTGIYDMAPNPNKMSNGNGTGLPVNFVYAYDPGGGRCDSVTCHNGGQPNTPMTWGKPYLNVSIGQNPGPGCYELKFSGAPSPAVSCIWDFGDGTGSTDCFPDHVYPSKGPFIAALTGRDQNYHLFSAAANVNPSSANILPTANATATVTNWTVTLTVIASDPDYNSCGHSGNGTIYVYWDDGGNGETRSVPLTNISTDFVFTKTYTGTHFPANIQVKVTDNAGGVFNTGIAVNVPATYSISGRVTHGSPATGLAGVSMYLQYLGSTKAIKTTDLNGNYDFGKNWIPGTYKVIPYKSGVTFSPTDQTVTIGPDATGVNFTATP